MSKPTRPAAPWFVGDPTTRRHFLQRVGLGAAIATAGGVGRMIGFAPSAAAQAPDAIECEPGTVVVKDCAPTGFNLTTRGPCVTATNSPCLANTNGGVYNCIVNKKAPKTQCLCSSTPLVILNKCYCCCAVCIG